MKKILIAGILALLVTGVSYSKEPKATYIVPDSYFVPVEIETTFIPPTPSPTPAPTPTPTPKPAPTKKPSTVAWIYDPEVSWYGPGFYGNRTACGQAYTTTILGVAHRSLPCGTLVEFRWEGKQFIVPVIDRGPYVAGRTWDLSGALCTKLNHCFTGPIEWRLVK